MKEINEQITGSYSQEAAFDIPKFYPNGYSQSVTRPFLHKTSQMNPVAQQL
jgi:hypothetical protein